MQQPLILSLLLSSLLYTTGNTEQHLYYLYCRSWSFYCLGNETCSISIYCVLQPQPCPQVRSLLKSERENGLQYWLFAGQIDPHPEMEASRLALVTNSYKQTNLNNNRSKFVQSHKIIPNDGYYDNLSGFFTQRSAAFILFIKDALKTITIGARFSILTFFQYRSQVVPTRLWWADMQLICSVVVLW